MFRVGNKTRKDLFAYFEAQEKNPAKDDEARITDIVSSAKENLSHKELIFLSNKD